MEEIIEELLESNLIKIRESIDYVRFLEIYKPYEAIISEIYFAEILGINERSYKSIKNEKGKRARILNNKGKNEQETIRAEIAKKIKYSKYIDYKKFLEMYEEYKNRISEVEFAHVLGINYGSYERIKNSETARTKVMIEKRRILREDKRCIQDEVLRKVKAGQTIDYKEFLKLYNPYREMLKEIEFAEIIGITYNSYYSIKTKNKRAKVLKERKPQEIKKIMKEVNEYLISGKPIHYQEFLKMYEPYKEELTEEEFAKILGIRHDNYATMKYDKKRARIQKNQSEMERIKYHLKEARYYSKEELEEMAKKYHVEVDEIIIYLCCKGKRENLEVYRKILDKEGQIWLGKTKCTKKFAQNHAKAILEYAYEFSKTLCKRYKCTTKTEDFAGQAIIYILERCGDIEKNYEDNLEETQEIIKKRIYMNIKLKCMSELRKVKRAKSSYTIVRRKEEEKEISIFELKGKNNNEYYEQNDVQNQVEEIITSEEKKQIEQPEELCVETLKGYINNGASREEAIKRTSQKLHMDPEKMLNSLKTYLIKNNKVKKTQNEEYILGE